MKSQEIRQKFLQYFKNLNHKIFPSDSLIPSSDPTLLFTTAGMVQFKDYFIGKKTGVKRACSVQKCLRTSDIEKVGHTIRHLTFFEMLGNFSFGDYFKEEAISWSWEFIVNNMNIDKRKLYVTVYKDDDEAYMIWSKIISNDKIYRLGEETNFWKMGDTGPCGPCSEIIYDLGEEYGCRKPNCYPGCDCNRYLEVWNLVFTQFDLQSDGKLLPLKQKNIDTGMGLERLVMIVNNLTSVFDIDLFYPLRQQLTKYFSLGEDEKKSIDYLNAICDHIRAVTFAISEGIIPTTEGRGYVVRKILRRAIRYLKLLNYNNPLLYKLVPTVIELMKDQYPELELHREKISVIVKSEEEKFLETLEQGMQIIEEITKENKKIVPAETVFKLYDTYGFPKELVDEIFKEKGITYNEEEFYNLERKVKEMARTSWRGVDVINTTLYSNFKETNFVGYDRYECESKILGIIKNKQFVNKADNGDFVEIIVEQTPFYGESGGQIGDTGFIKNISGDKTIGKVEDTKKIEGCIIHFVKLNNNINVGDEILLEIDVPRRKNIMRHHTATHLLHRVLRDILGEHAVQSGSLVSDDYFRFDFIHWRSLTNDELTQIELKVNQKILDCLPVKIINTDISTAKKLGATALFEEKYKEQVRVVIIGGKISAEGEIFEQPYSIELCGGTHCSNTGEIGLFKIISETSIGANLRRIEAICGNKVYEYIQKLHKKLSVIAEIVGTNNIDEIQSKVEKLVQQNKKLQNELENISLNLSSQMTQQVTKEFLGIKFYITHIENIELKVLRSLSDKFIKENQSEPFVLIIYSMYNHTINLVIRVNHLAKEKGFTAKKIGELISEKLNIKLGGREDFVQGGGTINQKILPENLIEIVSLLQKNF